MHFDQFMEAIRHEMQPDGRAQHMAGMLQPLLAATPADVTLGDLAAGWRFLARPRSQPALRSHSDFHNSGFE